jgi:hypothetical protein
MVNACKMIFVLQAFVFYVLNHFCVLTSKRLILGRRLLLSVATLDAGLLGYSPLWVAGGFNLLNVFICF